VTRVLVITKIFPNAAEPTSAPFNRQQIVALAKRCEVEVLGTIPWFPGAGLLASRSSAGRLSRVPREEVISGLRVRHPRTLFVPRVAHGAWAALYAASVAPIALEYRGCVDVVLGTWAYPDGVASIAIARMLGVPAVVKLHGSDMNVIAKMPGPRRQLRWALPKADRVVAVSRALANEARQLGVPEEKIAIVMNGVDGDLFAPRSDADRREARKKLGLPVESRIVLYVGNLKKTKGVLDLCAAFEAIPNPRLHLAIVGDGDARKEIEAIAARLPRITVAGARPLAEVPLWMAACDVLTLPSWAEGTPNVVLEALASGRRVVATSVGGIPDLVTEPALGVLVPPRAPEALGAALAGAAFENYDAYEVARIGASGGWDESAARLANVLCDSIRAR
jgi:teichuronic acid biosynthesis glycosyltransferase TuaC